MEQTGRNAELDITREDIRRIVVEDKDIRTDIDMAIVNTVHAIIAAAIRHRASDIHFEPEQDELRVRIRVDGALAHLTSLRKETEQAVIARLKVMSQMKLDEQRLPQDGRISLSYKDGPLSGVYNVRVSVVPKRLLDQSSEKIVLRILPCTSNMTIDKLGLPPAVKQNLDTIMAQPQGMFLLTGPTGSGKTTTLNAMLMHLNDMTRNILTIEDPVEYHIPGITQVQTHEAIGLTFASALRAFLRQDPDIIMVGEMRDSETAQIAVRAALTGHLVLSTLHTNDSPTAIPRLVDLGVEPYLLPSTLIGVMAQRLVRTLCQKCREPYKMTLRELVSLGYRGEELDREITLYRENGCQDCLGTGLKGRHGLYELLMVDAEMRTLLSKPQCPNLDEIRIQAKKSGMKQLRDQGLDLVLKGVTTVEQVQRVVYTCDLV